MSAHMVSVAIACSGTPVNDPEFDQFAREVGRAVAEHGCNLITGGGHAVMELVAEGFCRTPYRVGKSIGILPGSLSTHALPALGTTGRLSVAPKRGYPNPWIEVPIYTHLPGDVPKGPDSRNWLNARSADVFIALQGGKGTQAELEIALSLGVPAIALLRKEDSIGAYKRGTLPNGVVAVESLHELSESLASVLRSLSREVRLARPLFEDIKAVYSTDPASIHGCTMTFPNTCAIRMSEALDKTVPGIRAKFVASGLNLCPHEFMRGAEDLAAVLRRADVFGVYDAGFARPGSAPVGLNAKRGVVAYINIPSFPGQGHIDLWDGSAPVGDAYWDADPIWFWKLD
jgi:predicted Rossmann-fold nucleotide-binding protein